jgi:hypothetical protein
MTVAATPGCNCRRASEPLTKIPHERGNAVHAQFEVRTLNKLRNGYTDKAVGDLEALLDGHTMQLANYEIVVAPAQREEFVYNTLAEVRAYRTQFPAHFDYPLQQETFATATPAWKYHILSKTRR